jgi:hypothetical protein
LAHPFYNVKVEISRTDNNEYELWRAPTIEKYAGKQYNPVLPIFRHKVVDQQKDGQEVNEEKGAAKYHELNRC